MQCINSMYVVYRHINTQLISFVNIRLLISCDMAIYAIITNFVYLSMHKMIIITCTTRAG